MYQITLSPNKETKVEIHLNAVPEFRLPASVLTGIGDKKKRYRAHLDKAFKELPVLLQKLGNIHLFGLQKGNVALITSPKVKDFHSYVMKQWLEENREFLDSVMIYLFPNETIPRPEGYVGNKEANIPDELKAQLSALNGEAPVATEQAPAAQLSADDMAQINALIAADQGLENVDVFAPKEETLPEVKEETVG